MCWDISTMTNCRFRLPTPTAALILASMATAPNLCATSKQSLIRPHHRLLTNPRLVSLRLTETWRGCDSHVMWACYTSVSAVTPETGWQLGLIPIQQEIINGFLDKSWRLTCHQTISVVGSNSTAISLAWSFLFLGPSSLSVRVYATVFSPPIMCLLSFPTHSPL